MEILGFIFYFVAGAFARRWFGMDGLPKLWQNRGLQTAFMLALLLSIYVYDYTNWRAWLVGSIISAWLQFQFWSRGHGAWVDIGGDKNPTEDTIKRYNERWYHIPCDLLFNMFGASEYKYGFLYDFLYMGLRYTSPMMLMVFIDWHYLLIGLAVSPVYAFCHAVYKNEPWIRPQSDWYDSPTDWAEIICGGIVFSGCYLIGM